MMKVLWLCCARFSDAKIKTTGSWLQPLAEKLQTSGEVEVVNVTFGQAEKTMTEVAKGIRQYVLPAPHSKHDGMIPPADFCKQLTAIEEAEAPDLIHIWGTESIWGSAYLQGAFKTKAFVDIQGLLSSYYYYYYGGLSFTDILRSVHLKECILPWRSLFNKRQVFKKRGEVEIEFLKHIDHVSYQSEWVRRHVSLINPQAKFIKTGIMLRQAFYEAKPWTYHDNGDSPVIFTSASGSIPYKGIQILFRAVALLKAKYPKVRLHVAGNMAIGNLLQDGFSIFIKQLVKRLGIEENVVFLGPLDENQIIDQLQTVNVCVVPSFVETYCLAFAEAMMVGTPTIASYAGAMPELAEDKKESLFYNSLDFQALACMIDEVYQDKSLATTLSVNARKRRLEENNPEAVVRTQINNYKQLLQEQ